MATFIVSECIQVELGLTLDAEASGEAVGAKVVGGDAREVACVRSLHRLDLDCGHFV